jgi:hypothetical protein
MSSHKLLQVVLVLFGATCLLLYPLSIVWPAGWSWHVGPPMASDYFMMIVGVYATLGLFLIRAARDPAANRSLILFTIWSSLVHAAIMAWEALKDPAQSGHLIGDVPALVLAALVLGVLLMADKGAASAQSS